MIEATLRSASACRRTLWVSTALVVGVMPILGCAPMSQQEKDAVELRRFNERNPQAGAMCLGFSGRG